MEIQNLAVPSVYMLILFLGYPSQWLLMYLEPGPLTKNEIIAANVLLVLVFITYTKSVFVDAGTIPRDWAERLEGEMEDNEKEGESEGGGKGKSRKWCRKCDAAKPPRAHHCKECKRCIPKMDHHCPWTNNCVSSTTFPHFLRFLFYTTAGLSLLQSFLVPRLTHLWSNLDMPSYLGPTPLQLAHLFTILFTNTLTLFVLFVLLVRNIWCLAVNTTTIEGWEIERHRTLVRRARQFGGYLAAPDGVKVRIKKQEFPYDIGIWANIAAGMDSNNPLNWFNPFSPTPALHKGLRFPTNGFEHESAVWPPPDPDRNYRRNAVPVNRDSFRYLDSDLSREDEVKAFKARQAEDAVRRRKTYVDIEDSKGEDEVMQDEDDYAYGSDEVEEEDEEKEPSKNRFGHGERESVAAWRNSEGERLKDFGVDEDVEFYDEQDDDDDDVPLSELLARKRAASTSTHNLS